MTSTEITVRAHKRKKPQKQKNDPFQSTINKNMAERMQRMAAGKVNKFRNKIGFIPWMLRMIGKDQ